MSALDARMRIIAREELANTAAPEAADSPDRVTELEQQLAALTARVDELEKGAAPAPAKRTARKTTQEPTE
jgi:phage shock protein A